MPNGDSGCITNFAAELRSNLIDRHHPGRQEPAIGCSRRLAKPGALVDSKNV